MIKQLGFLALLGLPMMVSALPAAAQEGAACSTTAQAEAVIAGAGGGNDLVVAVSQSVPTDPLNCVPAYCVASSDKPDNVKVAVGAGISEAYSKLVSDGNDDTALNLLGGACSTNCDEVVLTAFAASQSTTVTALCEQANGGIGGAGGTPASATAFGGATGAGGGSAASGN